MILTVLKNNIKTGASTHPFPFSQKIWLLFGITESYKNYFVQTCCQLITLASIVAEKYEYRTSLKWWKGNIKATIEKLSSVTITNINPIRICSGIEPAPFYLGINVIVFLTNLLPPLSRHTECRYISTNLHGVTYRHSDIFVVNVVRTLNQWLWKCRPWSNSRTRNFAGLLLCPLL
jgi:hypothetical protein